MEAVELQQPKNFYTIVEQQYLLQCLQGRVILLRIGIMQELILLLGRQYRLVGGSFDLTAEWSGPTLNVTWTMMTFDEGGGFWRDNETGACKDTIEFQANVSDSVIKYPDRYTPQWSKYGEHYNLKITVNAGTASNSTLAPEGVYDGIYSWSELLKGKLEGGTIQSAEMTAVPYK